jgi:hypothetical protein
MTTTSNIARWVSDRAASDPSLPAIKQGEKILTTPRWTELRPASRPSWPTAASPPGTGWP